MRNRKSKSLCKVNLWTYQSFHDDFSQPLTIWSLWTIFTSKVTTNNWYVNQISTWNISLITIDKNEVSDSVNMLTGTLRWEGKQHFKFCTKRKKGFYEVWKRSTELISLSEIQYNYMFDSDLGWSISFHNTFTD